MSVRMLCCPIYVGGDAGVGVRGGVGVGGGGVVSVGAIVHECGVRQWT